LISEDVRRFAEDPAAWGEIAPETGMTRVLTDRYCILFGAVPTFTSVSRLRLDPDTVSETIAEVRGHVAERGHRETLWWVGSSATPGDLADRLQTHGLVPDERPGWEAHATSMALVDEPPAPPEGISVRRVESFEEFVTARTVSVAAFGISAEEAEQYVAIAEENFARERAGHAPRTYLAFADGEPVGVGRALVADDCPGVLMLGGAVLAHARGRGVYRALVHARWLDAVAAGTPALTTHAGAMSRPILERLGFQVVAEQEVLLDPTQ
jgi:GNAT superfamily N-acetyltransferase